MGRARLVVAACVVAVAAVPASASARTDFSRQAYNVLPPGQYGGIPLTRNSTDQARLYDALTPLQGRVTAGDIQRYFKGERFGTPNMRGRREATPRRGLKVIRDSFDVPHIFGRTRSDVEFGAGWVTAEDRGLFIETIRGPARIAALDVPGLNAFTLATSLRQFQPSAATERFISGQVRVLRSVGRKGREALNDVDGYLAGINAYYRKTHNSAKPWTRTDLLAAASLIGAVFGKGGGNEVASANLLSDLQARLGGGSGRAAWDDLRAAQDPEAPTTIGRSFSYDPIPRRATPGAVTVDAGSLNASGLRAARAAQSSIRLMSNSLLVGASRSATGRPLAVMGPQVGYLYPEFLMELDLHGGGIDARGAAFPGVSLYALVGRGKDYAWTATSSSSDNIDQFAEQLCNPDGSAPTRQSDHYLYNGRCRAMTTFDAGLLKGSGTTSDQELIYHQTVHGPVSGTFTSGGRPYAVALLRSSRGRESLAPLAFSDLNSNRVRSVRDFAPVMNQLPYTFNWSYIDSRHIALFSSGLLPLRAPGTLPGLPTLGTGRYDWRGYLSRSRHPQTIDPASGLLLNWNNKPAPGFSAADNNFAYSSVHRQQLFTGFKRRNRLQDVVGVMNRAATQDLPAFRVWSTINRVLAGGPAPDARTAQAAQLVTSWVSRGADRLDRNLDGKIDDPGAPILDAAFPMMATAELGGVVGPAAIADLTVLHKPDETPSGRNGSSYGDGWYGYVDKDLRRIMGQRVGGPLSRVYCGGGDLNACRASLWAALKSAADGLAVAQGSDPTQWRADATAERIQFKPVLGLANSMRWTNRPTFQQVIEFGGHR
jgi:hypothetical protein